MFEIETIKILGIDCLENCLVNLTNWYLGQYKGAFSELFQFRFDLQPGESVDGYLFRDKSHVVDCLERYYGIYNSTVNVSKDHSLEVLDSIFALDQPVVFMTSTYYCRWLPEYQKIDKLRFLILLDRQSDGILCEDPISDCHRVSMPIQDYFSGYRKIHRVNKPIRDVSDARIMLQGTTMFLKEQQLEKQFDRFLTYMEHISTVHGLYNNIKGNVWYSNFDEYIGYYMSNTPLLYQAFLQELCMKFSIDLEEENLLLHKISRSWRYLRNELFKSYVTDRYNQHKISILNRIKSLKYYSIAIRDQLVQKLESC